MLALPFLALLAAVAAATPPPEHCESEMNKIKDLLQVSCVGKGLTTIPTGLPKDTGILLLGSNCLAQVATASFQHLQQLSELDLSNNSLEALETSAPLPNLQQLLLSHNGLESLPAFPGLPRLKRLALAHNNISQVPEGGFRSLGQLRDLELQGNRLRSLPAGAFQGLGDLRDLDLSDNLLEALPPDLLAELPNLEILRLERNRLRHVPDGFFSEEASYAYVYLAENPWRCDCQLVYLRDWILENEISVYTRTSIQEQGSEKVVTENEPESVQCHEPPEEKGRPVMHFQMACGELGGNEDGEDPANHLQPPAPTPPTLRSAAGVPPTVLFPTPSSLSLHSRSPPIAPAGAAPTTTSTSVAASTTTSLVPSTAASILMMTTAAVAAFSLSTTGTTAERPIAASDVPTVMLGSPTTTIPTAPSETSSVPTTATATSPTFARRTTALMHTAPASQSTPPAAMTATRRPPSTLVLVPSTTPVESSPRISAPVSTHYSSPTSSSEPPVDCLCPALPARVLGVATHKGSPANWPVGYCCLLRLTLYFVCLVLVALPALVVLCWLGWVYLRWYRPALQRAPGAHLVRNQQWQKEWRLKTTEAPSPMTGPRVYRVCKKFRIGPSHVTWLLISLPGSAREWPWAQRQDRLSSYSLDQGRDTIGAVRIKYAAASL